jgi:hypothetical protein
MAIDPVAVAIRACRVVLRFGFRDARAAVAPSFEA